MGIELIELSNLLEYQKEFVTVNDEEEYKRCTAKLNRQGIVLRDVIKGKDIKTKKQQVCKAGQLLVAEIDAKVGGYGIVPPELEGAIVSSHYFLFNVNEEKLNRLYLHYYLKTDYFFNQIKPQGTTNYASIRPSDVLKIEIPLPSLERQKEIVEKLDRFFKNEELFIKQNENNSEILNKLRQSILQEAVQGKLVPQDHNDEPASVLLERIKEEKERLIKEGKIKIEKSLPPISEDEIPYELPEGWEWVRLGELCSYIQRGKSPKYSNIEEIPVISQKCIQWDGFDISKARFIDPMSLDSYTEERFIVPFDLLWNSTGLGTLGRINVYPKIELYNKVVADSHVTVIRPLKEFVCSKYLYLWFAGPIVQSEINNKSTGSTKQTELNITTVREYIVPLPPLNEQKRIVEKVDQLMTLCDELEKNIEQLKKVSELLLQSVFQQAFKEA